MRFVCRACPFPSPYPGTSGGPHWEFTATTTNGQQVGLQPPGRKGSKLTHTFASDDERQAAVAAVAHTDLSEKVRACYPDTSRPRTNPQGPTHTQVREMGPSLLRATHEAGESVVELDGLMNNVGLTVTAPAA